MKTLIKHSIATVTLALAMILPVAAQDTKADVADADTLTLQSSHVKAKPSP